MDTMTVIKIIFVGLLTIPVLGLSLFLMGKLIDEIIKKPGRER